MSIHLFSSFIFKHLKLSCYWVLWYAGPFTNIIQFPQVNLHIAVLLAKISCQVFQICTVKELYFIVIAIQRCAVELSIVFTDTKQDFWRSLSNWLYYRKLHMHTGMTFINCEVSSADHRFKKAFQWKANSVFWQKSCSAYIRKAFNPMPNHFVHLWVSFQIWLYQSNMIALLNCFMFGSLREASHNVEWLSSLICRILL